MTKFFTYSTAVLTGLTLLGSATQADAQMFSKRKQYTSIGVSLNAMNYFGDLNPKVNFASFRFGDTRPNIGVDIMHRFAPRLSGRFALAYGRVTATDATNASKDDPNARFRYTRNTSFYNDIYEASAVAVVDLFENRNNYLKRPDFNYYAFLGVAGFYHNPKTTDTRGTRNGETVDLQALKTEGVSYNKLQLSIPFGLGVRYRINRSLDASVEMGFRKTFTGYLDDVSGNYAGADKLTSDDARYFGGLGTGTGSITSTELKNSNGTSLASTGFIPGEKRGQGRTDWYVVTGVSVHYILRPKVKNPKFR